MAKDVEADRPIAAWKTNNRATTYLVEHLPSSVWSSQVPGVPRLTVGMIAAHIHNSRCRWIKSIGAGHGIKAPRRVDLRRVRPAELVKALSRSSEGMIRLIELGIADGGRVPRAIWQNFPTDLHHFLSYFAAHEGHPPRPTVPGRAPTRGTAAAKRCGGYLAMDETIARMTSRRTRG